MPPSSRIILEVPQSRSELQYMFHAHMLHGVRILKFRKSGVWGLGQNVSLITVLLAFAIVDVSWVFNHE